MTEQSETTAKMQPDANPFCLPWMFRVIRERADNYGIIIDSDGNELASSALPTMSLTRTSDRHGTFYLPEDTRQIPLPVQQMQLMTAAPKLLEALEDLAAASEFLPNHELILKARDAIAEATGQPKRAD